MAKAIKVQPEQIASAKRILQELPVKESGKTRQEAAALLAKEVQAALNKGYTFKDISEALKADGVPLSAAMIKAHAEPIRKGRFKNRSQTITKTPDVQGSELLPIG